VKLTANKKKLPEEWLATLRNSARVSGGQENFLKKISFKIALESAIVSSLPQKRQIP
jgi:hypothetical protein